MRLMMAGERKGGHPARDLSHFSLQTLARSTFNSPRDGHDKHVTIYARIRWLSDCVDVDGLDL
jgi:hypothetical protein